MKYTYAIYIILLLGISISCVDNSEEIIKRNNYLDDVGIEVPSKIIEKSFLNYDRKTSLWTLNNTPFSGYAVSFYSDSTLREKIGILNGKTEGQSLTFYGDGHLQQISNYRIGKLHGDKKLWSSDTNHVLLSHLNYQLGKPHGVQMTWYSTGELHKKLHMNMGKEDGIQQAFRKNSALYANYEAQEGRVFGLKKTALCFGLEDEEIQYEK